MKKKLYYCIVVLSFGFLQSFARVADKSNEGNTTIEVNNKKIPVSKKKLTFAEIQKRAATYWKSLLDSTSTFTDYPFFFDQTISGKMIIDGVDGFANGLQLQQGSGYQHLITAYADGNNPTTGSALQFKVANNNTGGNAAVMTLRGSGYVGIGTVSPSIRLHVVEPNSGLWAGCFFNSNNGAAAYFANGSGAGAYIDAGSNASASTYALYLNRSGTPLLYVRGDGNVGIGTTTPSAILSVAVAGTIADPSFMLARGSGANDKFKFVVRGSSGNSWLSIWDDSNGSVDNGLILNGNSVGIGTVAPSATLDVAGSLKISGLAHFTRNAQNISMAPVTNTSNSFINIQNIGGRGILGIEGNTSGNTLGGSTPYALTLGTIGSTPVQFGTNNAVNMTIASGGNVGIGTNSPSNGKLEVVTGSSQNAVRISNNDANYGTLDITNGNASGYGLYVTAYKNCFTGNVGIGTASPSEKLSVNGNVSAKKIIVTQTGWSDYVFDENYLLNSLESVETYIKQNKHLPDVPSAKEVEEKGISVGDNQALLLRKIEELTLYILAQQKRIEKLEQKRK
jgi:hypothetical protein